MPRGDSTRLMASEVPLMYGIVAEVVTLEGREREDLRLVISAREP